MTNNTELDRPLEDNELATVGGGQIGLGNFAAAAYRVTEMNVAAINLAFAYAGDAAGSGVGH